MPSFTNGVERLADVGPVVEVLLGPSRTFRSVMEARRQAVPKPVRVVAMIDTGASGTLLAAPVVRRLGIQPVGIAELSTPSSGKPRKAHRYNVSVEFPEGICVDDALVTEARLADQHVECLIGRDILRHGVLVYIGYADQFTISF